MEDKYLTITVKGKQVNVSKETVKEFQDKAILQSVSYINLLSLEKSRKFASLMWLKAPEYFFVVPASTSGKYHADWSTDIGGLVRHVLMGAQVAYDLSRTFGLTDYETDVAVVAMLGHDILKYGYDFDARYMDMHPFLPRPFFGTKKSEGYLWDGVEKTPFFDDVMNAIERHMGNLATGGWTSVGRIRPETPVEQVVHLADYIASRKNLVHTDYVKEFSY